jgi:hypothetical protein
MGDRAMKLVEQVLGAPGPVQRRAMAKAITLLESTRGDHRQQADEMLTRLLPHAGLSFRLGISGVPGVGKSTFIEALGLNLIAQGHRVRAARLNGRRRRRHQGRAKVAVMIAARGRHFPMLTQLTLSRNVSDAYMGADDETAVLVGRPDHRGLGGAGAGWRCRLRDRDRAGPG